MLQSRLQSLKPMAKSSARKTKVKAGASAPADNRLSAATLRKVLEDTIGSESVPDPSYLARVDTCSTGLLSLDYGLGVGGWALGRIHSIEGPEHSGKTALALLGTAQVQKQYPNDLTAIVDIESTFSESLAKVCGVDTNPERFIVVRPESAEQALDACLRLLGLEPDDKGRNWSRKRPPVRSIIYDSWAGSPTEAVGLAELARVGAERLPHLNMQVQRSKAIFWMVNQIREKPGVTYGDPRYSPGGKALKHMQTTRVWVDKNGPVEKDASNRRIGHTIKIDVQKNKLAPPFAVVFVDLNYYTGFDQISDVYALADKLGLQLKESEGGNIICFDYKDAEGEAQKIRENGVANFINALRGDPDAAEAFLKFVKDEQTKRAA